MALAKIVELKANQEMIITNVECSDLKTSKNARVCRVKNCLKSPIYKNNDLCNAHYIRLRRHGNLDLMVELHRKYKTPEYGTYRTMKQRCLNKNNPAYKNYGGRGITVCDRWLGSFNNFYQDMGNKPNNTSLERINNNLGYSPDNCKWATSNEQNNNRRNVHIYKGKTISDWADLTGIKKKTIRARLTSYNWGWERSIKC